MLAVGLGVAGGLGVAATMAGVAETGVVIVNVTCLGLRLKVVPLFGM